MESESGGFGSQQRYDFCEEYVPLFGMKIGCLQGLNSYRSRFELQVAERILFIYSKLNLGVKYVQVGILNFFCCFYFM